MALFEEIVANILRKERIQVTFPDLRVTIAELVEKKSYQSLQTIKAIIENDSLSDFECIDQIVCVLEEIGSDGGSRHDI